jgi:DNA adenine methylase
MSGTNPLPVWRTAWDALCRWHSEPEQPARNHVFHRHTRNTIDLIRKTSAGKGLYDYRQTWIRLHADRPAPTVTGAHGGVFMHPVQDRCLTPRELAALQDFPDDYVFCGPRMSTYTQIGNAVPIVLGRAVGEVCLEMLREIDGFAPEHTTHPLPTIPRSPLRFPGGKTRAIRMLLPLLPDETDTLVAPFFGGGAFELAAAACGWKVIGYDANASLVDFWQVLVTDPHGLANAVEKYHPLSRERFYELQQVSFDTQLERAAVFFTLNRASFSGLTRSGGMSPNHVRFTPSSIQRLRDFHVRNFSVQRADYRESIAAHPDALLLLDPPYLNAKRLYGARGDLHEGFDHECLRDLLHGREYWILCYGDCPEIRAMYEGYTVLPLHWKYGMSKRKDGREIVILSRDLAELQRKAGGPASVGSNPHGGRSRRL